MNILLVYPQYPNTFWGFKHALKFIGKKASFPPLGLLTVAAMLPAEWPKKLVDTNVKELKDEDISWADLIFISAMIIQTDSVKEIVSRCKKQNKTVVAGGPAFTTGREKFSGVDHFILNEAEITLPLFLQDLAKGIAKPLYASQIRPDIAQTPVPLWSLINFKDYASLSAQFSRGCPFNCDFCDIIIMNGRIPRAKTPIQLIKEMQLLFDLGWRGSVFIVDDNFIGNKTNVKKMLQQLIVWQKQYKFPFRFMTEASINLAADQELLNLMRAANFAKIFVGIETPDIKCLKECGKIQNTFGSLTEAVKIIQQNGLQVMGGFIVGFDNDSENIFETQIKFIQQTGIVTAMVGLLNALPQTQLWRRLKAEKRLLAETSGENTDGSLNFIPRMGPEKLLAGYRKILATIYSPKYYYQRIDTFTKNYKSFVKDRKDFKTFLSSLKYLKAFVRSIWSIGILSNSRLRYWKLIFKTILLKKKLLPLVIELAIYGQHFEKIIKKIGL